MSTRVVHLVVDAADPVSQAGFWARALGWEVTQAEPGEAVVEPPGFTYPAAEALPLVFVPVPGPKAGKNRLHLDLASASVDDQAEQVRRLLDLGAAPADIGQGEKPWRVLADPEGNEFCVLDPRPGYAGTGPVAAVVTDCAVPAAVARFWARAAGWDVAGEQDGLVSLRSPAGVGPFLEFLRASGPKTSKNRLHLDIAPWPGGDSQQEAKRLATVGATLADVGQGEQTWVVLADPEGNEFCVLSPR
jgi:predicted enzyme related to lactoylglutathione lyase